MTENIGIQNVEDRNLMCRELSIEIISIFNLFKAALVSHRDRITVAH